MSKRTRKTSKPAKPKAYVLLGANEYARPRAAKFAADADPELLAKAADTMHLWLIAVTNDELAELAARLPAGRIWLAQRAKAGASWMFGNPTRILIAFLRSAWSTHLNGSEQECRRCK